MLASMVWLVSNVPSEIYRLEIRVENVCSVCSSIMRKEIWKCVLQRIGSFERVKTLLQESIYKKDPTPKTYRRQCLTSFQNTL
jgi:hypothetical protein